MRPQSFDCGWKCSDAVLREQGLRFNEAAVFRLRMEAEGGRRR